MAAVERVGHTGVAGAEAQTVVVALEAAAGVGAKVVLTAGVQVGWGVVGGDRVGAVVEVKLVAMPAMVVATD